MKRGGSIRRCLLNVAKILTKKTKHDNNNAVQQRHFFVMSERVRCLCTFLKCSFIFFSCVLESAFAFSVSNISLSRNEYIIYVYLCVLVTVNISVSLSPTPVCIVHTLCALEIFARITTIKITKIRFFTICKFTRWKQWRHLSYITTKQRHWKSRDLYV